MSHFDFLSTHWAVFTATLNELYNAKLVEYMSTLKFSCCDHLVLAYNTVISLLLESNHRKVFF
jgi:hypothetical protein